MTSTRKRLGSSNDPRLTNQRLEVGIRGFPPIPEPDGQNTVQVLQAMKETLEILTGFRGDQHMHSVLVEDLVELDIIALSDNGFVEKL